MRQLKKVIFINSANIRYQEILLDGNVHLIGTQGVGKSTILRTILFFYNADTQKLGIPQEKKPYAEYYYPYTNSYILYEVQRETGNFTILTMRSGPGVAFRFIDAPFDKNWVIQGQKAKSSWQDIRVTLDQAGIDYSNKIDRLGEYRDIIYGNTTAKKAYQKYALLESKQYQSLPRTISNVFLNAKLEADFIKSTIINSLGEEPLTIDLAQYQRHLAEFEQEYTDVQKFKEPKALEQADTIIAHYNRLLQQEAELYRKAAQLEDGIQRAEEVKADLEKTRQTREAEKQEAERKFQEAEKRHNQQKDHHNANIKQYDKQIREARQKDRQYREKGIENIVSRVNEKDKWLSEQERLEKERNTLTKDFRDIEQHYQNIIDRTDNNLAQITNEQEAAKQEAQRRIDKQKEQARQDKDQKIQELKTNLEEQIGAVEEEYHQAYEQWRELRERRANLEARSFYAQELKKLDKDTQEARERVVIIRSEVRELQSEIKQRQKDWEREKEQYQAQKEQTQKALDREKEVKNEELQKLRERLNRYQSTLYGFLQANYPGWQENIGKVCREDVLFREDLNPKLDPDTGTFYGVQIDLANLESSAKTIQGYEQEAQSLQERIATLDKELDQAEDTYQQNLNKLKKRFQPKIREFKDQVQQLEAEKSRKNQQIEQWQLEREDLLQQAKSEKQQALQDLDLQIQEAAQRIQNLEEQKTRLNEEFEQSRKKRENAFNRELKQLQEKLDQEWQAIDKRYQPQLEEEKARKAEIEARETQALKDKGADTERLEQLENRLREIRDELQFIEDHQPLVIEYQKDKRELIDRIEEMQEQKAKEEERLQQVKKQFEKREQEHQEAVNAWQEEIDQLQKQLDQIKAGFQALEQISQTSFFEAEIRPWMKEGQEEGDPYYLSHYIDQIRDTRNDLLDQKQQLKETANRYLARFNDANLFNFDVKQGTDKNYRDFAADLKEFVDLNKIEELEQRVNARFADILSLVAKEIGDLISREGEIQNIITRINKDFRERNFVGVISSIEVKMEESSDRVVNMLKRIRDFDQEQGLAYGEANLFNQGNTEQQNKRAVELLRQLQQDIRDTKKEQIGLSDAFELRFRVVENENDTGWVEKLSNVGSEGTDILVKAMINIMLLNVFKESASRNFKDFRLHCVMDEIGRLHPGNVRGILKFANDRNILLINGSPVVQDAMAYRHIYELRKGQNSQTRIKRLVSVSEKATTIEHN